MVATDLIENLWPNSDNPKSVLKYSIHQLRKTLKETEALKDLDLIITTENGYKLNSDYTYNVDVFEFAQIVDGLLKKKENFSDDDYLKGEQAINLYKGKLYSTIESPLQIVLAIEKFSSDFARTVGLMSQYLFEKKEYSRMIELDYQAIIKEPFYEELHYYYIKGLIEVKDYHRAMLHYYQANAQFYNELGVGLSSRFKELYSIIKEESDNMQHDINDITIGLSEKVKSEGGFYCTYDMFKLLYEIIVKNAQREKKNCYLLLIDLVNKQSPNNEVDVDVDLRSVIEASIRKSDIFAKLNRKQFVVLLICRNIDNAYMIAQRIASKFYKKHDPTKYRVNYSVKEILPD